MNEMKFNIINGLYKRFIIIQGFILLVFISLCTVCVIVDQSFESVLIFIFVSLGIILFSIFCFLAVYFTEPHFLLMDFENKRLILQYRKKNIEIKKIKKFKVYSHIPWYAYLNITYVTVSFYQIEVEYVDSEIIRVIRFGCAFKKVLRQIKNMEEIINLW